MSLGDAVLVLSAKLGLDKQEYDDGLNNAKNDANGFASFLGNVGKVGAAAFAAVGTATVAMGTQAVKAYGDYEQLAGGIEKLFGEESAGLVAQYAEQAFLTSGKSINEYYNSVSQITASLKRSIGDDMEEVARVADVAMTVISDNVNTFGSDAEFVENAIMGLSRQNYTMIDNLKLGYAGTAQGMLELINDSGVLGKTLKDTSELANVGFDQMILAIEEVQKQQGIAGTTAKEALRTIQGSANATRKAWENVITAIGRGEGLSEALEGLTTAVFGNGEEGTGFLANIIPRIQTTMESIGDFVVQLAPLIAEKIPEVANAVLPSVLNTVASVTASLGTFIVQNIPKVIDTLFKVTTQAVQAVASFIIQNLPMIVEAGVKLMNSLADGINNNLPEMLAIIGEVLANIIVEIVKHLPEIIASGVKLMVSLAGGIVNAIPTVLASVVQTISQMTNSFSRFDWAGIGKNIVNGIANGIRNFGYVIADTITNIASNAWNATKRFFGISSPSKLMRDSIGKFIPLGMAEGIEDESDSVYKAMDKLNDNAMDSFDTVFDDISIPKMGELGGGVINYGGLTFNIYGAEDQDPEEIAMAVRDIIISEEERNKLVYA